MNNFFRGAAGTLTVLGLLSLGAFCGWKARERFTAKAAQEVRDEERRRVEEEQRAFGEMLNYNAATAYGMTGGVENLFGGDS